MDDLDDVEVARLTTMASGALVTKMLSAAASLGLADALGPAPPPPVSSPSAVAR